MPSIWYSRTYTHRSPSKTLRHSPLHKIHQPNQNPELRGVDPRPCPRCQKRTVRNKNRKMPCTECRKTPLTTTGSSRPCEGCGTPFALRPNARHCSKKCRKKHYKRTFWPETRTCGACEQSYTANWPLQRRCRGCIHSCLDPYNTKVRRRYKRGFIKCTRCDGEVAFGMQKYCGAVCAQAGRLAKQAAWHREWRRKGKPNSGAKGVTRCS
jgi:hypothetical protein